MKEQGDTRHGRKPSLPGRLALREPVQTHEQDDRVDREEHAAPSRIM